MAIVADQPAHEGEEELAERWVDIEEISPLEVVRGELDPSNFLLEMEAMARGKLMEYIYLAEMDLIEDNLIGMADAPESGQEGESSDKYEGDFIVSLRGCRG